MELDGRVVAVPGRCGTLLFVCERPGCYRRWGSTMHMLEFPELPMDYFFDMGTIDSSSDDLCIAIREKHGGNYYKFKVFNNRDGGLDLQLYHNQMRYGMQYALVMPKKCPSYVTDGEVENYPRPRHFYLATAKKMRRAITLRSEDW